MTKKGSKTAGKPTVTMMKEKAAKKVKQPTKAKHAGKKAGAHEAKKVAAKSVQAKLPPVKTYAERELKHFKEIILEKKRETMEELENLKESMMDVTTGEYVSESSTYSLHMEQGTDAMEREKTFLFASRGNKFVNQLDDALQRIENGTYGICRMCQLLVPKERLEAVPTAQTCAEYKNTNVPCERGRLALAKLKKH
ncbi:MAG: conjugal transfer protein TraR [Ignavibacteriae bacterium]|nr:conjugal transfer protein TraR [Ignavibacteriota bacterium]